MKEIVVDREAIARCGLYCGACRKFRTGKCPGCRRNERASWCGIRRCCADKGLESCAACDMEVARCKTYSNWVGKLFGWLFDSDREACIAYIRQHGAEAYAREMTRRRAQTMRRK